MNIGSNSQNAPKFNSSKNSILKQIERLDIEIITKNNDVKALEENLSLVMSLELGKDDFENMSQSTINKIVQIMQLAMEYLCYSNEYLDSMHQQIQDEITLNEKKIQEEDKQLKYLNREIKKNKEIVDTKNKMLANFKNLISKKSIYQCHICDNKYFGTEPYLDAHYRRRHPEFCSEMENFDMSNHNLFYQTLLVKLLDDKQRGGSYSNINQRIQNPVANQYIPPQENNYIQNQSQPITTNKINQPDTKKVNNDIFGEEMIIKGDQSLPNQNQKKIPEKVNKNLSGFGNSELLESINEDFDIKSSYNPELEIKTRPFNTSLN